MIPLAVWEEVIDASGVAPRIEAALPIAVRGRQLSVRTLLAGMCLVQADHRPAHRLMGLAPPMLSTATLLITRNQRILHAWTAR
jgi:hypothetical protein